MIPIGIDVSKKKLDIWMNNHLTRIANETDAIRTFFNSYPGQEHHIVMEADGTLSSHGS